MRIFNKELYASLRKLEAEGASDRKLYSELFKFLEAKEIPKLLGGLKFVQRGSFHSFEFKDQGLNYKENTFLVMPYSEAEIWAMINVFEKTHDCNTFAGRAELEKYILQEIEGVTDDKKYSQIPKQNWRI